LIEEGGVEAASLAAVTEQAGCTRPLLYRYFRSKEDLLVALVDDYYEHVDAQISEAEQRRVLGEASAQGADALRNLIGVYWDVLNEVGLGGAIVRCTPHYSERLRALAADSHERHEARFIEPWIEAGMPRLEAEITVDALLATFVTLALKARRGEVEREQAIDLIVRIQVNQFNALD
jgi:AcrR family transcriptional regulator